MFDEDKINELLRGASPKKKKTSSKQKKEQREEPKETVQESNISTSEDDGRLTPKVLQEIGGMIQSNASTKSTDTHQNSQTEKNVSMKSMQQRQEYIHERRLAEDRLRRLKKAEQRIEELERMHKEVISNAKEEESKLLHTLQEELVRVHDKLADMEHVLAQKNIQYQTLQDERDQLAAQYLELQSALDSASQKQRESSEVTQVFQEHGLDTEEYTEVMIWLVETGIFPLSYVQTQHRDLLQQILHDKCHIRAANIPLPKESHDMYIDASLERCPLSGGRDIIEQARMFKDECLINGYTTIVIFGSQGPYEALFQVLFAHHALRVTLSPAFHSLSSKEKESQIEANQLAFSWGGDGSFDVGYTSNEKTVGGFLFDLVSHLRSMS